MSLGDTLCSTETGRIRVLRSSRNRRRASPYQNFSFHPFIYPCTHLFIYPRTCSQRRYLQVTQKAWPFTGLSINASANITKTQTAAFQKNPKTRRNMIFEKSTIQVTISWIKQNHCPIDVAHADLLSIEKHFSEETFVSTDQQGCDGGSEREGGRGEREMCAFL